MHADAGVALLTIPQYSIFHALHLTNTMLAIIIPCCVSPFGFFLGRVYAQTSVPNELLEAARIDGAGEARIFFTIVLRLLAPAMVTIFLFLFVGTWNQLPAAVDDGFLRHPQAGHARRMAWYRSQPSTIVDR